MSELSDASFPHFGPEEIRNLPAMEMITGSVEIAQPTQTQALTDHNEVSSRQVSLATWRGDSQPDQSRLIRNLICEELRRVLGGRSRLRKRGLLILFLGGGPAFVAAPFCYAL